MILAIETSCDETATSVIEVKNKKINVLSSVISSQIKLHSKYGGVVPELAAREHVQNILPVIDQALIKAGLSQQSAKNKLKAIAVTVGPGLITSLQVGVETAKSLAYVWNLPLIAVNHVEGHIYSSFIENTPEFPVLALTVSGGHTSLVLMLDHGKYKVLGDTLDDAAGEAFDKAAKMMDLGYPGGPVVSSEATKFDPKSPSVGVKLPRPMLHSKNLDFSFSGLKTALLYELKKNKNWTKHIPEYCFEFEQAVTDTLIHKTIKAAKLHNPKTIILAGGVSANKKLRKEFQKAIKENFPSTKCQIPPQKYTTDNATMIAVVAHYKLLKKEFTPWQKLQATPNLEIKSLK